VTPARWCANADRCASAPALGGPAILSVGNNDSICFSCRERRINSQLPPAEDSSVERTYTLTEAADVLGLPRGRVAYLVRAGQLRASKAAKGARAVWAIAEADLRALDVEGAS
jgi:hypothetical protein